MNSQNKEKKTPGMYAVILLLLLIPATVVAPRFGCAGENGGVKIIRDCAGREVTVPAEVKKVVDLALLDGIRTMVELQVADRIIAVNDDVKNFLFGEENNKYKCWDAPLIAAPHLKNLLSVGNYREPNVEFIKSLEPDIVLMHTASSALANVVEKQTGLPVVCIKSTGCLDFRMLNLIAEITGKNQRAEKLISFTKKKIEQIVKRQSHLPDTNRVKVFFWGWPVQDSPKTLAPYDPIDLAGGVNVADHTGIKPHEIFDVTREQLAVWNPDVLILQWWTPKKIGVRMETILEDPALQTVSAVKNKRVFYSRSFMRGWDPAMGLCEIYYLAKLFYPEIYRDINVEQEGNEILKTFYGVDGLYTNLLNKSELYRWKPTS